MSRMRMSVYKVDVKTLKRGPVEREIVVRSDDSVSRERRDIFGFEPPCQCCKCTK
jgi:hypothetical protein